MDNELILNETNSGSVSSYHFIRVRCLFISSQGKNSPQSRFRTRMTRIARISTDSCVSASSARSVFHYIPSVFYVHPRLIFVSLNNRTRKNKPQMNADERRFVNLNTTALNFAYWYEKKMATNQTNSNELTSPEFVLVRTSSLLFSCSFMCRKFIADFAVKIQRHPNRSTHTNLKENIFFATQSRRSTSAT